MLKIYNQIFCLLISLLVIQVTNMAECRKMKEVIEDLVDRSPLVKVCAGVDQTYFRTGMEMYSRKHLLDFIIKLNQTLSEEDLKQLQSMSNVKDEREFLTSKGLYDPLKEGAEKVFLEMKKHCDQFYEGNPVVQPRGVWDKVAPYGKEILGRVVNGGADFIKDKVNEALDQKPKKPKKGQKG